jgi:hypothetical protein
VYLSRQFREECLVPQPPSRSNRLLLVWCRPSYGGSYGSPRDDVHDYKLHCEVSKPYSRSQARTAGASSFLCEFIVVCPNRGCCKHGLADLQDATQEQEAEDLREYIIKSLTPVYAGGIPFVERLEKTLQHNAEGFDCMQVLLLQSA